MKDFERSLLHARFFSAELSVSDIIGRAYSAGKNVIPDHCASVKAVSAINTERRISVSAISDYLKCQRKFSYSAVLGLSERSEDDPLQVVDHSKKGMIFHEPMKKNAAARMTVDELAEAAGKMWDKLMTHRPSSIQQLRRCERQSRVCENCSVCLFS